MVWGAAEGTVGDNRLKIAEIRWKATPGCLVGRCDFIDWVADYTIKPPRRDPGFMALRSRTAFETGVRAHRLCER